MIGILINEFWIPGWINHTLGIPSHSNRRQWFKMLSLLSATCFIPAGQLAVEKICDGCFSKVKYLRGQLRPPDFAQRWWTSARMATERAAGTTSAIREAGTSSRRVRVSESTSSLCCGATVVSPKRRTKACTEIKAGYQSLHEVCLSWCWPAHH